MHMNVEARLGADRRRRRRAAAHGALAQRPGRHGPAPLDQGGDRGDHRRPARPADIARRARGRQPARRDARLHAPAAGPAGAAGAPPAGLLRDVRARHRPLRGLLRPRRRAAPRLRRPGRRALPIDREMVARELEFSAIIGQQHRRRLGPRLRRRVPRGGGDRA